MQAKSGYIETIEYLADKAEVFVVGKLDFGKQGVFREAVQEFRFGPEAGNRLAVPRDDIQQFLGVKARNIASPANDADR